MATDASQLLSILRGTASPPTLPPSPISNVKTTTALDLLFSNAFNTSHPSTSTSTNPNSNDLDYSNNEQNSEVDNSTTEQNRAASSNLLSLLQNISKPSPTPSTIVIEPIIKPVIKSESSSSLLAQLMGSSLNLPSTNKTLNNSSSESIETTQIQSEQKQKSTTIPIQLPSIVATPKTSTAASTPPPAFTFVSPFDLLSTFNEKKLPSTDYIAPVSTSINTPIVESQTIETPISTAPSSVNAGRELSPITTRNLLASSILATFTQDSTISSPSWAPKGVQIPLPNTSSQSDSSINTSEKLNIDIGEEHLESLSLDKVDVQPVTLFSNEMKWERGKKVVGWSTAMAYATKGGKIRVIDKATGGRILLKGHTSPVIELVVSRAMDNIQGQLCQTLATLGSDGRVIVWRIRKVDPASHSPEKLLDISGGDFSLIKLHPLYPLCHYPENLALIRRDGKGILVDLKAVVGCSDLETLESKGKVFSNGVSIIDLDFSECGHKFAVLDSNRNVTIRSLEDPAIIIETIKVSIGTNELSGIHLLSNSVIIASQQGTQYNIITFGGVQAETHQTSFILPHSNDTSHHFGHSNYTSECGTLFVSSSLRGSIFALALSPDNRRVSHVLEICTSDPVICFNLNYLDLPRFSALIVHSEGVNLISFDYKYPDNIIANSPTLSNDDEDGERAGRRMSLEASILVESQTQIEIDEADLDTINSSSPRKVDRALLSQRRPSVNPVPEEEIAEYIETVTSVPIATSSSSTSSAINSAIKSMKAKNGKQSSPSSPSSTSAVTTIIDENTIKQESPAPTSSTISAKTVSDLWASGGGNTNGGGGGGGGKKGGNNNQSSSVEVMKELKRLEESIPARVTKLVAKELEKISSKTAEAKVAADVFEIERQEASFKTLTASLSKVTTKQLEISVKEQIKLQIVPSLNKLVSTAVSEQVSKGMESALNETLPNELARLLHRPEIIQHLTRNFSATIEPLLERNIATVLVNSITPLVHSSMNLVFDKLVKTVRNEMGEVRKEIVREQSGALETTEREVVVLREDLRNVKATLARMESLLLNLSLASVSLPPSSTTISPVARRVPSISQNTASLPPSISSTISSPPHRFPPIPRNDTPTERYEELFTNALQPENEPEFVSLLHLINSSPATRAEAVFPPQPSKPRISPPVVLSLAYRLSSVIQVKKGKLEEDGKKQLQYIRKCITAMDGKDSETAAYTPRILESVIEGLSVRGKALLALNDLRGAEEVRTVEVYARSRFDLVSQRAQR